MVTAAGTPGKLGFGDSLPLPEAGTETWEQAWRYLEESPNVSQLTSPETALACLGEIRKHCPALACGLETALLDLECRQTGKPMARLIDPRASQEVRHRDR